MRENRYVKPPGPQIVGGQDIPNYIQTFVQDLEKRGCLRTEWLKQALFKVPRHLFIDQYYEMRGAKRVIVVDPDHPTDEQLRTIYSDRGLMIREPPNHSAASQPSLVLDMLEDLEVEPGKKVLELGTGSGWNAGLLAFGLGDDRLVYSMDIQPDLVEAARIHLRATGFGRVNLRVGDGGYGWPEEAPFDRIIVTVGSPDIPLPWREQLADGGVLLVPLKTGGIGDPMLRLRKHKGRLEGEFTRRAGFMTLQGAFWAGSEDPLEPPWDPLIEKLLSEEPKEVSLSEPMSIHCWFFLHIKGRRFQALLDYERKLGWHPALFDSESEAIFVTGPEPLIWVYGDRQAAEQLALGQREWIVLGRPKIADYKVELVDPGLIGSEDRWIDKRPYATLKFSLDG